MRTIPHDFSDPPCICLSTQRLCSSYPRLDEFNVDSPPARESQQTSGMDQLSEKAVFQPSESDLARKPYIRGTPYQNVRRVTQETAGSSPSLTSEFRR